MLCLIKDISLYHNDTEAQRFRTVNLLEQGAFSASLWWILNFFTVTEQTGTEDGTDSKTSRVEARLT